MKIVYCINRFENIGGIERITIAKANALAEVPGNDIYIITAYYRKQNSSLRLNPKVTIINLDVHYYEDIGKNRISTLLFYLRKRKEHRHKLEMALNEISPDIVISVGGSDKNYLPSLKISSNPIYIREMHYSKYYRRIIRKGFVNGFLARVGEFLDYRFYINKYDKIVVLTEEDKKVNWKNNPKVIVIPNPITETPNKQSSLENKVVIAAGRLALEKNFKSLISAWVIVNKYHPDWHLKIFGDGDYRKVLEEQIDSNNLSDSVSLCGFTDNILAEMAEASIYAMSSLCEGFPLVLIEAMGCGLPVVSYDCPCGPKDIIRDGENGFLVPVNDEKGMADKMMILISHDELRLKMGALALDKAGNYSMEKIVQKWMELFEKQVNSKIASA